MLSAIGSAGIAQCDKKVIYTAAKGEFQDANGNVQKTVEEKISVSMDKKEIALKRGDDNLTGEISNSACSWKEAYKTGKTNFKTELVDNRGDSKPVEITIEGKDGKIMITIEFLGMERKLKIYVDEYKENN